MKSDMTLPLIIRALGRGKKGTRDLTRDEAKFVMDSILDESITGPQLGAFLMLMRVKEETAEEISGMVESCESFINFIPSINLDINWPAYAGKKKQPSWYILAAKLLAQQGVSILIHGGGEHTEGRQYAQEACRALDIPIVFTLAEAENKIKTKNIAYISLQHINQTLSDLIDMKAELGLRSPTNTLIRHLNPLQAKVTLQGMFHPAYMPLHHESAKLLNQQNNIVLKGDGGEFEVRPDSETKISVQSSAPILESAVPASLSKRSVRPESVEISPLNDLWAGKIESEYGQAAVIQTAAIIFGQLKNIPYPDALKMAQHWWANR